MSWLLFAGLPDGLPGCPMVPNTIWLNDAYQGAKHTGEIA